MNRSLNIWNLYQSEINVLFSRFASFIEVGGRTGLGFRDTAQDAMCIPHAEPAGCKWRIMQLLNGLTSAGYGLHLFDPAWFEGEEAEKEWSPTVVPKAADNKRVHGIDDACADDALWLIPAIVEYVRETGDAAFFDGSCPMPTAARRASGRTCAAYWTSPTASWAATASPRACGPTGTTA